MTKPYEGVGYFEEQWRNPPPPFNPNFDPKAHGRYEEVTRSMEADDFYRGNYRETCAAEWRRRYEALVARDLAADRQDQA